MERMHSDLERVMLAGARLEATFMLAADGSITRASDALQRLRSFAPPTHLLRLSDMMDNRTDVDHLLQWLRHSRGLGVLSLQSHLRVGPRSRLAIELLATSLPVDGSVQAFCAVRTPVQSSVHEAELAQQLKRQNARLQQLRQDQTALLESEFRWRFALEGSDEGVWDWDVQTGEAFFSPLWKHMIGYSDDEISPRFEEWRDRIHPQDQDRVLVELNRYLETERGNYRIEFRMRCRDGSYAWILSRGTAAVRDRDGLPLRIIGTHKNITRRVQERQLLEQSETRLRAITDNARTILFMKDMEGRYVHLNRHFEDVFQLPRHQMLGKTDYEVFPLAMAERYRANDRLVLESGQAQEMEEAGLHPVHGLRTFMTLKVPLRDAQGQVYGLCGVSTDITERKRMEDDMRIAALAFESRNAMLITDDRQVIQRVNQAFVDSTGYAASEVLGRTPEFLRSSRHDAAFYAAMWQSVQATGSWQGEVWGRRKNGMLYPKWQTISAVRDAHGRVSHYVKSATDISAGRQAGPAVPMSRRTPPAHRQ